MKHLELGNNHVVTLTIIKKIPYDKHF